MKSLTKERDNNIYSMRYIISFFYFLVLFTSNSISFSQDETWRAKWIGLPYVAGDTNIWTCFRKEIVLNKLSDTVKAKVATDSKYWLWINGILVVFEGELKRGPNPNDTYYDEVEIAHYLQKGKNTIAILTWYWGRDGFDHKNSGKPALLFQVAADGIMILSDRTWKVIRHPAFGNTGLPLPNYRLPEFNIHFDARKDIGVWQQDNFNDTKWVNATEYGSPPVAPWNSLVKRPIPFWKDSGLRTYVNGADIPMQSDGQLVIAKLPKNITITPYLKIKAPAGLKIDIRTDNYKGGSEYNVRAEYITKEGVQEFETLGYMNGHDVYYSIPPGVEIISLEYRETRYDTKRIGEFLCNDSFYNRLWVKSYNTLNVNLRDAIQDPDRERAQWWGDAVILIGEILYSCDENGKLAIQKAIRNLVDWQKSDGVLYSPVPSGSWDKELPTQMLASIGKYGFWNYFRYTGDTAMIRYVYSAVKKYLSLWKLGEDGLVVHRAGGWDWLDWGKDIDPPLIDNSWYYMALDAATQMATLTGNAPDTSEFKSEMKSIKENFNRLFWNGQSYKSPGNKGVVDDRGNGLAVVAGLAEPAKFEAIKKVLQTKFHASPYMEKYIMESLFVMHDAEAGLARMKKRYANMVNSQLTTLWESWGIGSEGYGGGSYNHGWSGGPLTLLSQYIAGITPDKPDYETFSVMPQPGKLTEIRCVVPSSKGEIILNLTIGKKTIEMVVNIPENTQATVGIPKLASNLSKISVNGECIIQNQKTITTMTNVKYIGDNSNYFLFHVRQGRWLFNVF